MTIKELKQAKTWIAIKYRAGDTPEQDMQMGTICDELIDAEIARQSVTDEDVRGLIEAIQENSFLIERGSTVTEQEKEILVSALRAYRPQEPCEFCEGKNYLSGSAFLEDGQIELSMEHGDFNYCPNCGREV